MILQPFRGKSPRLGERVFIAPNAVIIGDVEIGDDVSIWYGSVLRGDINTIRVGARSNIQDNCILHITHETPVLIGEEVTIGHGVIAHGCRIGARSLIGMGSILLDGSDIGESCLVGAGSLVTERMTVPSRHLVLGSPAKIRRPLVDAEVSGIQANFKHYLEYKEEYLQS